MQGAALACTANGTITLLLIIVGGASRGAGQARQYCGKFVTVPWRQADEEGRVQAVAKAWWLEGGCGHGLHS